MGVAKLNFKPTMLKAGFEMDTKVCQHLSDKATRSTSEHLKESVAKFIANTGRDNDHYTAEHQFDNGFSIEVTKGLSRTLFGCHGEGEYNVTVFYKGYRVAFLKGEGDYLCKPLMAEDVDRIYKKVEGFSKYGAYRFANDLVLGQIVSCTMAILIAYFMTFSNYSQLQALPLFFCCLAVQLLCLKFVFARTAFHRRAMVDCEKIYSRCAEEQAERKAEFQRIKTMIDAEEQNNEIH